MTSYLSYFTSHTSSAPSSQASTPPANSTWSSTFSSRIATLRKALTKDSEEDDPDNEDCSHISNVLRAYYTEKGRPFPEWLPPDPKKPIVAPPQPQGSYGQYNPAHGAQYSGQEPHSRGSSGGRGGGLSDLWDTTSASAVPPPQSQSLRAARITPHSMRSHDSGRSQSSGNGQIGNFDGPGAGARPLPSQRAGSYQANPVANPAALGSRDRLRARLQGGGSGRSSPSAGLGSGGNGSQGLYGAHGGSHGSQSRSGSSQAYMSASEPWSSGSPGGETYGYNNGSTGGNLASTQYGNRDHRQRPGGPR